MSEHLFDMEIGEGVSIPVYSDVYMDPSRLFIIGVPEKELSKHLVDTNGRPLQVASIHNLKKIGVIHPHHDDTVTVIDWTEHETTGTGQP